MTNTDQLREQFKAAHNRFHGRFDTHGDVAIRAQWTPQELENVQIEDEELFYDELASITATAVRAAEIRVTLELMEKHHIPLQTHTLDTELDTILDQAVKPKLKQDVLNLLEDADMNGYKRGYKEAEADYKVIIERETARARIDELERLNFQEASGFLSGGNMILRQSVVTKRIAALTSPPERKKQ